MTKTENMKNAAYMLEKRGTMLLEQAKMDDAVTPVQEAFIKLLHDDAFAKELSNCAEAEAVKELLDRNGVDFSLEEIKALQIAAAALVQKIDKNDGELSEEELEQIAGGWSWKGFGIGILAGLAGAALAIVTAAVMIGTAGMAVPFIAGAVGAAAAGGVIGGLLE